jgi:hypothetical protein
MIKMRGKTAIFQQSVKTAAIYPKVSPEIKERARLSNLKIISSVKRIMLPSK